jgi:hypothetical protein
MAVAPGCLEEVPWRIEISWRRCYAEAPAAVPLKNASSSSQPYIDEGRA